MLFPHFSSDSGLYRFDAGEFMVWGNWVKTEVRDWVAACLKTDVISYIFNTNTNNRKISYKSQKEHESYKVGNHLRLIVSLLFIGGSIDLSEGGLAREVNDPSWWKVWGWVYLVWIVLLVSTDWIVLFDIYYLFSSSVISLWGLGFIIIYNPSGYLTLLGWI